MRLLGSIILLALLCLSFTGRSQTTITLDSSILSVDTVVTGLDVPWEIKWGPDGKIWTTERYGVVSRIDPVTATKNVILNISALNGGPVYQYKESGLLGMALHPDFVDTPYVYLVYTYLDSSNNPKERLARYEYINDSLVNPVVYIDSVRGSRMHDGSRLLITPDRYLFMTCGDGGDTTSAQKLSRINGKILRFHLDGTIPTDNPVAGSPIYSWGHRNSQGLLWVNGIIYNSEHGPDTDDEVNIIEKGRNYGWPFVRGYCDSAFETAFCIDSNVKEPIAAWTPTIAPSGIDWYSGTAIPEWHNTILMAVLKNKEMISLHLDTSGRIVTHQTIHLANQLGRLRQVLAAPDGSVWIATNGQESADTIPFTHSLVRLRYLRNTGISNVMPTDFIWSVYPNPASKNTVITANFTSLQPSSIKVYNMQGMEMYSANLGIVDHININLPIDYAAGVYNVQLTVGAKLYSKKMVVE